MGAQIRPRNCLVLTSTEDFQHSSRTDRLAFNGTSYEPGGRKSTHGRKLAGLGGDTIQEATTVQGNEVEGTILPEPMVGRLFM